MQPLHDILEPLVPSPFRVGTWVCFDIDRFIVEGRVPQYLRRLDLRDGPRTPVYKLLQRYEQLRVEVPPPPRFRKILG